MRPGRLSLPVVLAVTSLALASCTPVESPDVAEDATDIDACPDPFACVSDFVTYPDGGFMVIYRRTDGGVSDVPCPAPPPGCAIA